MHEPLAFVGTDLRLRRGAFVRAAIEHRVAGLAGLLSTVHRSVGAGYYLLWGLPTGGAQTYADTRRYHPLESFDVERASQGLLDPPGNPYRVACARDVFEQHSELVPPEVGSRSPRAHDVLQTFGDRQQYAIPRSVAQRELLRLV